MKCVGMFLSGCTNGGLVSSGQLGIYFVCILFYYNWKNCFQIKIFGAICSTFHGTKVP
jgi:hypothetical protein